MGDTLTTIIDLLTCVVESTNKYGVRSSKRTDEIHRKIADIIEKYNENLECKIEHKIGTICVDICVFSKKNKKLLLCVSVKASQNNIKQNEKNNENIKLGESDKIKYSCDGDVQIIFLDIVPVECPYYSEKNKIKKIEKNDMNRWIHNNELLLKIANRFYKKIDDICTIFVEYDYVSKGTTKFKKYHESNDFNRFISVIKSLECL